LGKFKFDPKTRTYRIVEPFWERWKLFPKVRWIGEPNSSHISLMTETTVVATRVACCERGDIRLEVAYYEKVLSKSRKLFLILFHEFFHFLIWRFKAPEFLNTLLDWRGYFRAKKYNLL